MNRKAKSDEKKRKTKAKRKLREEETLLKVRSMVGLGPISDLTIEHFKNRNETKDKPLEMAVRELLNILLDFNEEELDELGIKETRRGKDEIVYIAADNTEMIREIYTRKANSQTDEMMIRNYVPPQLHARYMALTRQCTQKRAENPNLKTQVRYGHKDLEIFIKIKGSEEGYKKTCLNEFMGNNNLPPYNHSIKWKKKKRY